MRSRAAIPPKVSVASSRAYGRQAKWVGGSGAVDGASQVPSAREVLCVFDSELKTVKASRRRT